jgi:probable F420-dependent oxidoreductase
MDFGVTTIPADFAMPVADLGRAVEEAGFESLFLPEHTHIPVSRRTPFPYGAELPDGYRHQLDPFVALTAIAGVTTTLKLGTGICLVAQHDPILLAKTIASLDFLSNGRFLFGVAGGWNREEMANHSTKPAQRWEIMRERILAMKQIWTTDEPEYHGSFVDFDPIWCWPKPAQKPHPPVLIGGGGPGALARVVEYGDGWMPGGGGDDAQLPARIAELNDLAREAGRRSISVTAWGAQPDPKLLERYQKLGIVRAVFRLPTAGVDEILPSLDRFAAVAREFQ